MPWARVGPGRAGQTDAAAPGRQAAPATSGTSCDPRPPIPRSCDRRHVRARRSRDAPLPLPRTGWSLPLPPLPSPPPPHLTAVHVLGAPTDRVTPPREGARPRARGRVAVGRRGLSVRPSVRPSGPGRVRNGRQRPPRALPPPPPGRAADLLPAHGEAGGPGLAARRIPPVRCAGARGRAAARLGCRRGSAGDGSSRFGSAGLGRGGLPAPLGAAAGPCAVPAAGWRSGVRRLAP